MGQGKAGWWIAGAAVVVVLISVGYGIGRRGGTNSASASQTLTPAGAPLSTVQIEPIQPQQELAAITSAPASTPSAAITDSSLQTASAVSAAATSVPAVVTELPKEESARIREIQKALKSAGFDPGSVDGRMGARTRTAIRDFQIANGLEPDGKVGPRTWNKLEAHLTSAAAPASSTTASSTTTTKTIKASND